MESLVTWFCEHGPYAPLVIFGLLVITGFSIPVSEDLILLASGALASTVLPEYTIALFCAAFFGSFISDCVAYGLGRVVGIKMKSKKMVRLAAFYKKFGILTLFVGRCIPFGIRNGIFMTAGAGKMKFYKFLLTDGIACFLFSLLLFYLGFTCGKNYDALAASVHQTSVIVGIITLVCVALSVAFYYLTKRTKVQEISV
ncbi:MAG: VTT domain-containing protein [Chlamydiales bacterium]|nr:VTT domain-containing protein [Chlamydiales bacterium]